MSQESTKERTTKIKATPRAIALLGPHGGGKTTLLESIAMITGAIFTASGRVPRTQAMRGSRARFGES